jgi:LytS/YehU family sensor histidine kinase
VRGIPKVEKSLGHRFRTHHAFVSNLLEGMTLRSVLYALVVLASLAVGLVIVVIAGLVGGPFVAVAVGVMIAIAMPLCELIWNVLTGRR